MHDGGGPVTAEVVGRGHQRGAEVPPPEVIDGDARGQRIGPVGDPARQCGAAPRAAGGVDRAERSINGRVLFQGRPGNLERLPSRRLKPLGLRHLGTGFSPRRGHAPLRPRQLQNGPRRGCSLLGPRGTAAQGLEIAGGLTEPGVGGVRGDACVNRRQVGPREVALGKVDVQAQPGRLGRGAGLRQLGRGGRALRKREDVGPRLRKGPRVARGPARFRLGQSPDGIR